MPEAEEKTSPYLQAGSPLRCHLATCRKPFMGSCVHGRDEHFYCSHACADEGERTSVIKQFKRRQQ